MATSVRFGGTTTSTPQALTTIDKRALTGQSVGAAGIIAFLGTAVGGVPVSLDLDPDDFMTASNEQTVRSLFRSGDLLEMGIFAFSPGDDQNIPGGAQQCVFMKTNQSTPGSAALNSSAAGTSRPAILFTSQLSGLASNLSNVQSSGAPAGPYAVTVNEGSTTETIDGIGGEDVATFEYLPGSGITAGWNTSMALQSAIGGVRAYGKKTVVADQRAAVGIASVMTLTSGTANNAGKVVTLYGVDGVNTPLTENVTLDSSGNGTSLTLFPAGGLYGASSAAGSTGSDNIITNPLVITDSAVTTILTIGIGTRTKGVVLPQNMWVAGARIGVRTASGTAGPFLLFGLDALNATASERVASAVATGDGLTVGSWDKVTAIVNGAAGNVSLVFNAAAVVTRNALQQTVSDIAAYFNARAEASAGFTASSDGLHDLLDADLLDLTPGAGTSILSVAAGLRADLNEMVTQVTARSAIVAAEREPDSTGTPAIWTINCTLGSGTATVTIAGTTVSVVLTSTDISAFIDGLNANAVISQYYVTTAGTTTAQIVLTALTSYEGALTTPSVSASNLTATHTQTGNYVGHAPDDTTSAVYLTGGSEGVAVVADYITALTLLEKIQVNAVVPLNGDPVIHALVKAHCLKMKDRRAYVGFSALDGNNLPTNVLPTKSSTKAQVRALNSYVVSGTPNGMQRIDSTGVVLTFLPWFMAGIAAGMEMAAEFGLPITNKVLNVIRVTQDSTINTSSDSDDLINSGMLIARNLRNLGIRWARGITTWLKDNNLANIESSVDRLTQLLWTDCQDFATRELVGQRGSPTFLDTAKSGYKTLFDKEVREGKIISWDPTTLILTATADVLTVAVKAVVPVGINFVETTVSLALPVFVA